MHSVFKPALISLMLIMAFVCSFGQIELDLKLDQKTGDLIDPGMPLVRRHDVINWVIKDPGIRSFALKKKTRKDRNIFTTDPEGPQAPSLSLEVAYLKRLAGGRWNYTINWVDSTGAPRHCDPKIAIRPIIGLTNFLVLLGMIITAITSLLFFSKLKNLSKRLENLSDSLKKFEPKEK
jgi:hypothetical protein